MRSLLNFLLKYNHFILFLLLQVLAVYLLSSGTGYHNIRAAMTVTSIESFVNGKIEGLTDYLSLREVNSSLVEENLKLRNRLERIESDSTIRFFSVNDTARLQQYIFTPALVVNNSVHKQKNFITLDKGSKYGIREGMAVVGQNGIAGVIVGVSNNYSVAMSILNLDFRQSARFRKNKYFGSLSWDGIDIYHASLNEIPTHINVEVGDTVETSGYSAVFPAGQMIGTVSGFDTKKGNFYNISVELTTDFSKLNNVYIIGNLLRNEQSELEQEILNKQVRNGQ